MSELDRIDSHLHLWDPGTGWYDWMSSEFATIAAPFDADDAWEELSRNAFTGAVIVQGCTRIEETRLLLSHAEENEFIQAVIGWVDLTDPAVAETIACLADGPGGRFLAGFRHPGLFEAADDWISRPEIVRGIAAVGTGGRCFELLVTPAQLPAATSVVRALPSMTFVLDHIGEPDIANGRYQPWAAALADIAREPNVYCKFSGMATHADWARWEVADLRRYADHVLEVFGPSRIMYGSDWPYCTLAATYDEQLAATTSLLAPLSGAERALVMGDTAAAVYRVRTRA
ncbi:amidohydrolase family protein [Nocardia thailandica]|uniref:amidohydrolase family protein n=1 Tax=Nocardia thailandica TaxID=257275 RepID=UPI0002EDF5C1|nr:amidohydrolase family protein [Nocardia thailandica]